MPIAHARLLLKVQLIPVGLTPSVSLLLHDLIIKKGGLPNWHFLLLHYWPRKFYNLEHLL